MSQFDYIKDIAKFGLENDQEKLLLAVNELIEFSKKGKKINFALQLQSIIKESFAQQRPSSLRKVESDGSFQRFNEDEMRELILEKLTSDYSFDNLVCDKKVREELDFFIKEHLAYETLKRYELPVSNKILLHGPSGCGKTLASYVIAGELDKMMIVVNLGAIVSSKLGETSKNLAKIFRKASTEDCIIFIDEFDSLGKVRDYNQDHGEMKRVVNTILQLFDYLPQSSIVIAATNQKDMIDSALLRRFDMSLQLELPQYGQISDLIGITLKNGPFKFDKHTVAKKIMKNAVGLSYYSIQKTLVAAIKRSIFSQDITIKELSPTISTSIWEDLIEQEKVALNIV
ncbi:AAA family ATPase [Flavobacterium hauense]